MTSPDRGQATSRPAAIAKQIEQEIRSGKYPPGFRLPSRSQLAEQFDVGQTTIVQAMELLKYLGLVRGHQGRAGLEVRDPGDWVS